MSLDILNRLIAKQDEARKKRDDLVKNRESIVEVAKQELREDLEEAEDAEFRDLTAQIAKLDEEIQERDPRITELNDEATRTEAANKALRRSDMVRTGITHINEGRTYVRGAQRSYFRDLAVAQTTGDPEARARLERHAQEVATEPEYRDITRVDGAGGYFVPPQWLVDQYVPLARAGRPTANLVQNLPLPPGTDSINIPAVTTGTGTAIQTADNGAVQETNIVDAAITAAVKTIAGQQDLAIQLIDQSPVNFDEVIFGDLMADYATKVDLQVLSGANSSGEVKGILTGTNTNAVTYTDTTPTVGELYSKIADGIQRIHTSRFQPPTAIVMHPRRWAWMLAALDTQNRPLIVPNAQGPFNAAGTFDGVLSQQVVGQIQGLPVITDASIPITGGAGTNQDTIVILRASDSILWESPMKTRVLPDVGSGNLTVRLQVYGYLAFTYERYPLAVSTITGTGLTSPSF